MEQMVTGDSDFTIANSGHSAGGMSMHHPSQMPQNAASHAARDSDFTIGNPGQSAEGISMRPPHQMPPNSTSHAAGGQQRGQAVDSAIPVGEYLSVSASTQPGDSLEDKSSRNFADGAQM